jgi:hypothetical protein
MKIYVNVPSINEQNEENLFFDGVLSAGSGSLSQWFGSPDPYRSVTDPQHCFKDNKLSSSQKAVCISDCPNILLVDGRIWICTNTYGSGSEKLHRRQSQIAATHRSVTEVPLFPEALF